MAPWKLPLVVAAIVVPIIGGFFVGGGGAGLAAGAIAVLAILLIAIAQKPDEPIASAPGDGARHVLIVAAAAVEEPDDVARMVRALGLEGAGGGDEVRVLVPARIGFLDRWASDVEAARRSAQRQLVATVAALAKAGVVAEARVGDEDVVQAVEDQLQSYPATDVLLVDRGEDGEDEAAAELGSRLEAEFQRLRLAA